MVEGRLGKTNLVKDAILAAHDSKEPETDTSYLLLI